MNCYKILIEVPGVMLDYCFYTMRDTIYQATTVAESVCEDYGKNATVLSIILMGKAIEEFK